MKLSLESMTPAGTSRTSLLAGVLTAVGLGLCFYSFVNGAASVLAGGADTGWLIRTGQWIVEHRALPHTDLFTWTNSKTPLVSYQWLFEVIIYLIFKNGGLSAVGATTFALVGLLYFFALPRIWSRAKLPPVLTWLFLAPVLTPFWFFARPQIITYTAALMVLLLLERWRTQYSTKLLFLLPVVILVWANMHCFAALGVAMVALYLFVSLFEKPPPAVAAGFDEDGHEIVPTTHGRARPFRRLLLILILSIVALFITPFDYHSLLKAANIFAHTDINACNELKPLFVSSHWRDFSNLYVLAALLVLFKGRRKLPFAGFLISIAALLGGLAVARLQPLGVLLSWSFVGMALADFKGEGQRINLSFFGRGLRELAGECGYALLAVGLALFVWFAHYRTEAAAWTSYLGRGQVLSFVSGPFKNPAWHMFNDTISGSRLIFLQGPPVYIDSRLFLFERPFYDQWLRVINGKDSWAEFSAPRDGRPAIDAVILTHGTILYETLMDAVDWRLIVDDGETSFWLPAGAGTDALLAGWKFDPDQSNVYGLTASAMADNRVALAAKHYRTAATYFRLKNLEMARSEIMKSLDLVGGAKNKALLQSIDEAIKAFPPTATTTKNSTSTKTQTAPAASATPAATTTSTSP